MQDTKANGPAIGLRFAPVGVTGTGLFTSVSHVDITLDPYYGVTGDGEWHQCVITKNTTRLYYYGNDPTDQTGFGGSYVSDQLWQAEGLINAESAMTAGNDSASNWVLTAVYIVLETAGARTCYIDNVQIGTTTYTLEPYKIAGAFNARKTS
jgi:hypothetical protein